MSNYVAWDLYSLGRRAIEWRERAASAASDQERQSYEGELAVIEREFDERFFTGPYWPDESMRAYWAERDREAMRQATNA